jgi:hypothetical protein
MMTNNNLAGIGDAGRDLNGLIPTDWADQIIKFRVPYSMPGELVVAADATAEQFNEATFLHTIDKPFEIHRMHVALTGLNIVENTTTILEPQPTTLDRRVRLRMEDTAKNQVVFKSPHLVSTLQKLNEQTWEWEVPYTIGKQEGFTISVDTDLLPSICQIDQADATCATSELIEVTDVRVEIALQGYLIVLRPADSR